MTLAIREMHAPDKEGELNQEWLVIENAGERAFHTGGCRLVVSPPKGQGGKPREVGKIDPGFALKPGERHRIVTGNPARKALGKPPEDAVPNYYLFAREPALPRAGWTLSLFARQVEMCRAAFDPAAPGGIARE